jgi:hypothetical protein
MLYQDKSGSPAPDQYVSVFEIMSQKPNKSAKIGAGMVAQKFWGQCYDRNFRRF